MYINFKRLLGICIYISIGVVVGISGLLTYQNFKEPKKIVMVTGTAEINAVTDQATISAEIKNTATTNEQAKLKNNENVESLKKMLYSLGVPESRIIQSDYSQGPHWGLDDVPDIYPITNSVPSVVTNITVTLDSIENIEKVIEVFTNNPNTRITNTYYSLNNRKNWEDKAREAALKNAREQIETVAKINNLKIGKLVSLQQIDEYQTYPRPMYDKTVMSIDGDLSEPMNDEVQEDNVYYEEQTIKVTATYQARYELY